MIKIKYRQWEGALVELWCVSDDPYDEPTYYDLKMCLKTGEVISTTVLGTEIEVINDKNTA